MAPCEEVDLLSVDIDGNDYHVIQALEPLRARVVVAEYNAKFAPPVEWVMKYDPRHRWDRSDDFGASLESLSRLLELRGYTLVGCSITGVNAFYVRSDLVSGCFPGDPSPATLDEPARYWLLAGMSSGHRASSGAFLGAGPARSAR